MKHPFLTGKSIYLKALEPGDLSPEYFQWLNDPGVCEFNSHAVFPNSMKVMREYLERIDGSRKEVVFAILSRKNDVHIGNIALQAIDWIARSAEFAILIGNKKYFGKGIGFEAGSLLIEYAFERLNLRRIHCGTHQDNQGMRKLAEKLGMKEEGRRREALYKNGKYADLIEYGLVRRVGGKSK